MNVKNTRKFVKLKYLFDSVLTAKKDPNARNKIEHSR